MRQTPALIQHILLDHFEHEPTADQSELIRRLADYLGSDRKDVFIMRGYAGTGKTTAISALTGLCRETGRGIVLLAPTGRAAKVMTEYSNYRAYTIHKYIYTLRDEGERGYRFELRHNKKKNTLFIVDEASMIHDEDTSGTSLLRDLLTFVKEHPSNKLILSGDIAQLPPVQTDLSPALVPAHLRDFYGMRVAGAELKDVVRQKKRSGILENATLIRDQLENGDLDEPPTLKFNEEDVFTVNGNELGEHIETVMGEYGESGFLIVTRSNKLANIYNDQIRRSVLYRESRIDPGDLLMVVQNNYFWKAEGHGDFVANGEILSVQRTTETEEKYGFHFMDCSVSFADDGSQKQYDVKILTDVLNEAAPRQSFEKRRELFGEVYNACREETDSKRQALLKVKEDPYYNALQVKFAYSVTCHKSQGGQWPAVFVDHSFFDREKLGKNYLRWLYTAVTRATSKLYFVNLPDFFPGINGDEQ